jgi:hypothetical protein
VWLLNRTRFIALGGPKTHDSSGRHDKGESALPLSVVAEQDPFFIALGGPKAHDSSGRDDKGEGRCSPQLGFGDFEPVE